MPVDEYTLTQMLGKNESLDTLRHHWDTFIVEDDFKGIVEMGLNLVRIPIGYWAFKLLSNDTYVQGQEEYLDKAILWAQKNNLKVQLDLHGMPGSQNGFDNSGLRTDNPDWLETETNMNATFEVLNYVLNKYTLPNSTLTIGNETIYLNQTIDSIEVVNEPFAYKIDLQKLQDFYGDSYELIRNKGSKLNILFQDGFLSIGSWDSFMTNSTLFTNITIDHHLYEIFSTYQIALNITDHLESVINQGRLMAAETHDRIVGEFSGALTDCTKYINGVGRGARYDGTFDTDVITGSCANHTNFASWTEEFKRNTKEFIQTQFDTYAANGRGWIFWTYKTEDTIEWDLRKLHQFNLLPESYNSTNVRAPLSSSSSRLKLPQPTPLENCAKRTIEQGFFGLNSI